MGALRAHIICTDIQLIFRFRTVSVINGVVQFSWRGRLVLQWGSKIVTGFVVDYCGCAPCSQFALNLCTDIQLIFRFQKILITTILGEDMLRG